MWCIVCTFGHWWLRTAAAVQQALYMDKKCPRPVVCSHICFYSVESVSRYSFKLHCLIIHFIFNVRCGYSKRSEQYRQCRWWSVTVTVIDTAYAFFTVYVVETLFVRQVRSDSTSQSKLSKPFPSVMSINTYTTTTSVQKCTLSDGEIWKI